VGKEMVDIYGEIAKERNKIGQPLGCGGKAEGILEAEA
jgi:hypothetical protein